MLPFEDGKHIAKSSSLTRESVNIEEKENDGTYKLSESQRNELKRKRMANGTGSEIFSLVANIWPSNWSASQIQRSCQVDV